MLRHYLKTPTEPRQKRELLSNLTDEHFESIGRMPTTPYVPDPKYSLRESTSDTFYLHQKHTILYIMNMDVIESTVVPMLKKCEMVKPLDDNEVVAWSWEYDHAIVKDYQYKRLKPILPTEIAAAILAEEEAVLAECEAAEADRQAAEAEHKAAAADRQAAEAEHKAAAAAVIKKTKKNNKRKR
jgi:hypothetical protein